MIEAYKIALMQPVGITSNFGTRTDPKTGKSGATHYGMDLISNNKNNKKEVYAVADGVVLSTVTNQSKATTGYGNTIWIRHKNLGWSSFYAHLASVKVKKGDTVKQGQVIGIEGSTGKSTGIHLHFGIQYIGNSTWQNPKNFKVNNPNDIIIQPVERDENKNQLKVLTNNLRVRREASTKSDIRGFVQQNKIYNYYNVKNSEGYTWYQIDDIQWIANNGKWLEVYPKKEDEKMIEELNKQIEDYKNQIKNKNNIIVEKDKTINELNEKIKNNIDSLKLVYECTKNGLYKIYLKEKEIIYIK